MKPQKKGHGLLHVKNTVKQQNGPGVRDWGCLAAAGVPTPAGTAVYSAHGNDSTNGPVTVITVDEAGNRRYYLLCGATSLSEPGPIPAWKRRS